MDKFTIPEWRRMKNISQNKMADALGMHVNTYRAMEAKPTKLRLEKLIEISRILGVSLNDIRISGSGTENRGKEG